MRKHIVAHILWAIVPLLTPTPQLIAGEPADTTRVLKSVEVTARSAEKEVVSTAPIHRYSEEELRRQGITSVADAVHRLPGVTLRDYGGAGGLKTVSVRGFGAGHTAVIYDGITLSDAQSGQIDLQRYSTDNVGQLSLVVGDNEDIFIPARAAASAASLTIASVAEDWQPMLVAQMRGGSWSYVNPFVKGGIQLSENAYGWVLGEFTHAKNDYPFTLRNGALVTKERRNNSRMNSGHGEINLTWRPWSGATLKSKVYYYDNSRRLPGPVIYYNDVSNESLRERNAFAQSQLRASLSANVSLMAIAKFNFAYSGYADVNGKYPNGVFDQRYWQREWYGSACALWAPSRPWVLDYSVDYSYANLSSNLSSNNRPWRHSLLQSATARYRAGRFTAMARLLLSVYDNGAHTGQAAKDATRLSPSASVSVQPWREQNFFVRVSYKEIFRMPTFNEAYFDHYGSADVLPETTRQLNLGFTYSAPAWGALSALTATVDGYFNNISDMIVAVPYNMFVWRMTNLGHARIWGVDATANADISIAQRHTLSLTANYSYQRAQPRTSRNSSEWMKQVAYIPLNSGSLSVSWENPWANLSVNATGVGTRFTTNNNLPDTRISGYMEFGLRLWRLFPIRGHTLETRIDVLNLGNKQYEVVARYPMPGRSWQATLRFTL